MPAWDESLRRVSAEGNAAHGRSARFAGRYPHADEWSIGGSSSPKPRPITGLSAPAELLETMSLHDPRHYVRRVVLPSGKTIEVVYFEDQQRRHGAGSAAPTPGARRVGRRPSRLRLLRLHPGLPDRVGRGRRRRTGRSRLRCPNCEWAGTGVFEQELVERFDEELDRGTEALVRDLKRLAHANMEDEIERFTTALDGRITSSPRTSRPSRALPVTLLRDADSGPAADAGPCRSGRSGVARDDAVGDEQRAPRARRSGRPGGMTALAAATCSSATARASSSAPVAAMRSQTASASAGVAIARGSSAASAGSRSRARMNGSVTVPSSRSVPRCLPVRSAGPATSRTSSRIWKARPMRRPNSRSALGGSPRAALQRAEHRTRPRRAARSSARSAAGSAPAGSPASKASARCSSSPRASAEPASLSARTCAGSPLAASSANARANSRSPVCGRRGAAGGGEDRRAARGAAARGRARRRGRASRCGRARRPWRRAPGRRRPAARRPRRGSPAAGAGACRPRRSSSPACSASTAPWPAATSRSSSSTRSSSGRTCGRRRGRWP